MTGGEKIFVNLAGHAYDIHIGDAVIARMGEVLPPVLRGRTAFIVTDTQVAPHILPRVAAAWTGARHEMAIPAGEASKTPDVLFSILSWMLENGLDRHAVVIAAGGGVVGDIAGLAAALAMRGVPYIQIPTTLLAQVDSAVGGKTAINMAQGKNMVGAFHQPSLVLADTQMLRSLPARAMRAGYAEIVKYAAISDAPFFSWLEQNGSAVLARDEQALVHAIAASCRHKAAIVTRDEREEGERMMLNFGHTFGHALEKLAGYNGTLLHGEAVAIGMAMAMRFSQKRGLCDDADRLVAHLRNAGLPVSWRGIAPAITAKAIIRAMKSDKKNAQGHITLILARGIGKAFICRDMATEEIESFLDEDNDGR